MERVRAALCVGCNEHLVAEIRNLATREIGRDPLVGRRAQVERGRRALQLRHVAAASQHQHDGGMASRNTTDLRDHITARLVQCETTRRAMDPQKLVAAEIRQRTPEAQCGGRGACGTARAEAGA